MTINQVLSHYAPRLKSSSPVLDIELLLAKILAKNKEYLYANPQKKLTIKQLADFTLLFRRRLKGEPIAYLLGHKEFYGLDFLVNKNVLIPRPETELLVESVIQFSDLKPQTIIDIGTGSGAIIIALAKKLTGQFYATDISLAALKIAKQNAQINKVKIKFLNGNLLMPLNSMGQQLGFDYIITANLPYVASKGRKLLVTADTRGLNFEPRSAWAAGSDGLKYFQLFFKQINQFKLRPRAIFLEMGYDQAIPLKMLIEQTLPNYKTIFKKDLCGLDRLAIITK